MNFIHCKKLCTGFAAIMLFFAAPLLQAAEQATDNGETLIDFPDRQKQSWCGCQDAAYDYERITKDSAFYEQVYRILGEGESKIPLLNRWVAAALFKNGTELTRQGKYSEAIALFDELLRRFAENDGTSGYNANEILSPHEWAFAAVRRR